MTRFGHTVVLVSFFGLVAPFIHFHLGHIVQLEGYPLGFLFQVGFCFGYASTSINGSRPCIAILKGPYCAMI